MCAPLSPRFRPGPKIPAEPGIPRYRTLKTHVETQGFEGSPTKAGDITRQPPQRSGGVQSGLHGGDRARVDLDALLSELFRGLARARRRDSTVTNRGPDSPAWPGLPLHFVSNGAVPMQSPRPCRRMLARPRPYLRCPAGSQLLLRRPTIFDKPLEVQIISDDTFRK